MIEATVWLKYHDSTVSFDADSMTVEVTQAVGGCSLILFCASVADAKRLYEAFLACQDVSTKEVI